MPTKKDGSPQAQNGGRPLGAATRLTRAKANEIVASGRAPLDVLMKNMWFWDDLATALGNRLEILVSQNNTSEQANETLKVLGELSEASENALRCAIEAAPYVHPKLQSVAIKPAAAAARVTLTIPKAAAGEDRKYREKRGIVAK